MARTYLLQQHRRVLSGQRVRMYVSPLDPFGRFCPRPAARLSEYGLVSGLPKRIPVAPGRFPKPRAGEACWVFVSPFAGLFQRCKTSKDLGGVFGDLWGGNWIIVPYFALKDAGLNVYLSDRIVPGHINIMALYPGLLPHLDRIRSVCRPVYATMEDMRPAGASRNQDFHIVQNILQARDKRDYPLPLFPPLRLQPRSERRSRKVTNIIYNGCARQLHPYIASPEFARFCRAEGFHLRLLDKSRIAAWADFRLEDVFLAVRPPGVASGRKPPSKLINAWCGGLPAILGPESAYRRLRRSPLDYIEVRADRVETDIKRALLRLRTRPALYEAMRQRCRERAKGLKESILKRWRTTLQDIARRAGCAKTRR